MGDFMQGWGDGGENAHAVTDKITGREAKPTAVQQAERGFGEIMTAIANTGVRPDVELIAEIDAWRMRVLAHLTGLCERERAELTERWGNAYRKCRQMTDRIRRLQQDAAIAANAVHPAIEHHMNARGAHQDALNRRPARAAYPSAKEMAAWQASVDSATGIMAEAAANLREARNMARITAAELNEAQRELAPLRDEEISLRDRLDGTSRAFAGMSRVAVSQGGPPDPSKTYSLSN
jgi:hypothetical protein